MKSKLLSLAIAFGTVALSNMVVAQENDDMYFSSRDRENLYASAQSQSINSNLEFVATAQNTDASNFGEIEDANNQYFIKDYSIKNKTDNEVKTYSGINSTNGYSSGVNMVLSLGSYYNSPYSGYYNPYNDPFSPYYDPFYTYRSPNYYTAYGYNRFRSSNYNGYNSGYGYNGYNNYNNGYSNNSSNICATTSYSNNVRSEVKYRNGRKIISGSRASRSVSRGTTNSNGDRPVINTGTNSTTNGRTSSRTSRKTYRTRQSSTQNRSGVRANTNRSNSYNRSNNTSHSNSSYRKSSGMSSGSRSSFSGGSRSSGSSARPSSGGSRSSSSRGGRGN